MFVFFGFQDCSKIKTLVQFPIHAYPCSYRNILNERTIFSSFAAAGMAAVAVAVAGAGAVAGMAAVAVAVAVAGAGAVAVAVAVVVLHSLSTIAAVHN